MLLREFQVHHASVVRDDSGIDHLGPYHAQASERSRIVPLHHAGIADDVGDQDRGESADDGRSSGGRPGHGLAGSALHAHKVAGLAQERFVRRRPCIAPMPSAYYNGAMRTMTVRVPDALAAEIEAESRTRGVSKSDVVRERLEAAANAATASPLGDIADLVGSVHGLPSDLSSRKKEYLRATGYGRKRPR